MGRKISLFADYHGKENSATNYCGLMFKLVHQESPRLFSQLLDLCFAGEVSLPVVGPVIEQQNKKNNNIPDLEITQAPFQIFFETKTLDWYHEDQLDKHICGFSGDISIKILVLLCKFEDKNVNPNRNQFKVKARNKGVTVVELTFEDLIFGLDEVCQTPMLQEYLLEFREYLERNDLLPTWKYRLDVVNCGVTRDEILNDAVYMCPDTGGTYSHRRAQYLGTYWDKAVNDIFLIDALVSVSLNGTAQQVKWNNDSKKNEKDLKRRALDAVRKYRADEIKHNPIQVFLLSEHRPIHFEKDTLGGLYGSKKYFVIKEGKDIDDLADIINNAKWSQFQG